MQKQLKRAFLLLVARWLSHANQKPATSNEQQPATVGTSEPLRNSSWEVSLVPCSSGVRGIFEGLPSIASIFASGVKTLKCLGATKANPALHPNYFVPPSMISAMLRLLFSLLFCLLFITACKKKSPEPAPEYSLEGHWRMQTTSISTYWPTGAIRYASGPMAATGRFRAEISVDSIIRLTTHCLTMRYLF